MNSFEIDSLPDAVHLRLNFEVTIEVAHGLHAALVATLAPARPLIVDAVGLTRIDAAILQILLAAAKVVPRAQLSFASPVWSAAFLRHGITDPFVQP